MFVVDDDIVAIATVGSSAKTARLRVAGPNAMRIARHFVPAVDRTTRTSRCSFEAPIEDQGTMLCCSGSISRAVNREITVPRVKRLLLICDPSFCR